MTYGLEVKNNNNDVIISSDMFHYHFIGKYTHTALLVVPDLLHGVNSPNTPEFGPTLNKGMENLPAVGAVYEFQIPVNGIMPPMCFIKPGETGLSAAFAAIVLTQKIGVYWKIRVFQNRATSIAPILYCFSPLDQVVDTSTESVGMQIFNASGARTFDSRYKPLRILATGADLKAPTLAHTGSTGSTWYCSLDVNSDSTASTFEAQTNLSDLIYYAPTLAHSCQEHQYQESDSGIYNWENYSWVRGDIWWCFYQSIFRLASTSTIQANYGVYARGHIYEHKSDSASVFDVAAGVQQMFEGMMITVVFAVGGIIGGSYRPYENSSRNTAEDVTFFISKASFYD